MLKKFESWPNNGMLRHSLGGVVIFVSLQHFMKEGGNKGMKSKKGAINWCNETKISSPILMSGVYSFVNLKSDSARMCKI